MSKPSQRRRENGNAVLEFALVAMPLTFLLLGVTVVGLKLGRMVQCTQVGRDAASMYVRGVDFSKNGNKDILVRLSEGLGMTRTGGYGVVILSQVTWISQEQCTEAGLSPCNADQHVITQRIIIGNPALRTSRLGTPDPALIDSSGLVNNYMQQGSARANFPYAQLSRGEFAYVAEAYFDWPPTFDMAGFRAGEGVYTMALF